jgi:hypothetical protein
MTFAIRERFDATATSRRRAASRKFIPNGGHGSMRYCVYVLAGALSLGLLACSNGPQAEGNGRPKHTVKQIMKLAHKSGLMKQAILGAATDAEKKELVNLYVELSSESPEKGTAESWKQLTAALLQAAKDVEAGRPGSGPALRKAVDCDTCHKLHK